MGKEAKKKIDWIHTITILSLVSYIIFGSFVSFELVMKFVYKDPFNMFALWGLIISLAAFLINLIFALRKYE